MHPAAPADARTAPHPAARTSRRRPAGLRAAGGVGTALPAVGVAVALAVAVALRFLTTSDLWLDEALTVHIADRPVPELLAALRRDGHPPLFYLLLHLWMRAFGTSDVAVRALSGLCSVGALIGIWFVGRRLGGRRVAWAAVLLLAVSPFAVRYATETRMYALLLLLTVLGALAYLRVREEPSPGRLAALGLASGALLLTHYWAFFLLAALGGLIVWSATVGGSRADRRAFVAVGLGALLFLPWVPTFLHQLAHTGTPWGEPGRFTAIPAAIGAYAGGIGSVWTLLLGLLYVGLAGLALFCRPLDAVRYEVDLRGRPVARELAWIVFGTLTIAIVVGQLAGSAYSSRYATVTLAPFVALAALGVPVLGSERLGTGVLAVAVALGLVASVPLVTAQRTQAGEVAEVVNARADAGDLVLFCPDQLGPAHHRLLREDLEQVTYPDAGDPELVDWVDYAERNEGRSGRHFGRAMHRRAGDRNIWLISAPGYATFGQECERIAHELAEIRTSDPFPLLVPLDHRYYEPAQLFLYEPNPVGSSRQSGPL